MVDPCTDPKRLPPDLTTTDQEIEALLRAVAEAMEETPLPQPGVSGEQLEHYLGDIVELTFNGGSDQRIELIARLLTFARVVNAERDADLRDYAWLRRLERPLRRWERDRRDGSASPRPRPAELDARTAMFSAAIGPDAVIGAHTVALSVAELVAIHQLAGTTTLEEGMAARAALTPLMEQAAALLGDRSPEFGVGRFEQPGATLAHVEQATWQIEQILQHPQGAEELPWLRGLWLEVAAAIVCAHDLYERRVQHDERWRGVLDLAAEKVTVGGLADDPAGFDEPGTLTLVRSVALSFAALWLDEERGVTDGPGAAMLDDRLVNAAARALIAAYVAQLRLDAQPR